ARAQAGWRELVARLLFTKVIAFALVAWSLALPPGLAAMLALPLATMSFIVGLFWVRLPKPALLAFASWSAACWFGSALPKVERDEVVVTMREVPADAARAWDGIKAFGPLTTRPFGLLALGLPVPTHCALEREGERAHRTCYFDKGRIEQ